MQAIRNAVARLVGGGVSHEEHEAAQLRILELLQLSAAHQVEIIDQCEQLQANRVVIAAYQEDLQQTSAEVVRLRAALARLKGERNDWRDRALQYREKMGGQKRKVRG